MEEEEEEMEEEQEEKKEEEEEEEIEMFFCLSKHCVKDERLMRMNNGDEQ